MKKILIANRGEIACRIARTAKRLNIRTVAVFSDADARAQHVAQCDEAIHIGPPPARESYLDQQKILDAARRSGADAIHPGYGFLSENADFAEAVIAAGLIWIGPPPNAIRAMGGKAQAKALMAAAGVPLVPGYHGDDQSDDTLGNAARQMGYPLLIKASAGGGGKGMKIVEQDADFAEALASARREAAASFGDDRVLLEKYIRQPRHIEVQVFCDQHGNGVYLYERDCSIQRRHQKVVEEAPAPNIDPDLRARLGAAALAAARSVAYVGAGTVEFLVDADGGFYFMEMNTRLQVEHPVTEAITGFDLVAWQCLVADGHPLPVTQDQIAINGHAIEVRFYAEDADRGFLPQTGHIRMVDFPHDVARIDTGIASGDDISVYYDPMIAKIITHGPDRLDACQKMVTALAATKWDGPICNLDFLRRVVGHPAFMRADLDTGFIERFRDDLLPKALAPDEFLAGAVALDWFVAQSADRPKSVWTDGDGWWLNHHREDRVRIVDTEGHEWPVRIRSVHGVPQAVHHDHDPVTWVAPGVFAQSGHRRHLRIDWTGNAALVRDPILPVPGCAFHIPDDLAGAEHAGANARHLTAPMPGKVTRVAVSEGQNIAKGTIILVLEAMKMEHSLTAPADTVIESITARPGDQVREGEILVHFAEQTP